MFIDDFYKKEQFQLLKWTLPMPEKYKLHGAISEKGTAEKPSPPNKE